MAKKEHISETPATQMLRKHQVVFSEHPYPYEEHGGTAVSARELGVPEHAVRASLQCMDSYETPVLASLTEICSVSAADEVLSMLNGSFCPYRDASRSIGKRPRYRVI